MKMKMITKEELADLVDVAKLKEMASVLTDNKAVNALRNLGKDDVVVVEKKKKCSWKCVFGIVLGVAVVCALVYAVIKYFKPEYEDEFMDDIDDEFYDDDEDLFDDDAE